ncbi:22715_t:CDS:2, partial [Gigaspora margarita]
MWQQLKKAWSESAKGKKARWFAEIERQTLVNNTSRLVKNEFWLDKKRQQTVRPPLFKHKKDKRNKDWIIFEDQKKIENFTVKLIWTTAEDKLRQDYRIQDLKKLLFGISHKEKIKARLWRERCKKVIKWEENTGIRKALKEK